MGAPGLFHRHLPTVAARLREPAPAWPLALGRITVFAMLAVTVSGAPNVGARWAELRGIATLPPELMMPPAGWGWLTLDPFAPWAVGVAAVGATTAAILAAVGVRVRVVGVIAVLLAGYVLAATYWYGKVDHNHHLLWLGLLLAVAPSTDTLAPGRWRARPEPSGRYGGPLKLVWAIIGVTYLFPGLTKVVRAGAAWVTSDSMANLVLQHRWNGQARLHPIDPDALLPLLQVAAAGVVLFELAFLLLVWSNRTRPWLVAAGIAFHLGTGPLLGIWGWGWLAAYPLLLGRHGVAGERRSMARAPAAIGTTVLCGALVAGMTGLEGGWPFAAYPGFGAVYGPASTRLVAETTDGTEVDAREFVDWMRPHRSFWMLRRVTYVGDPGQLAALEEVAGAEVAAWWVEVVDTRTGRVLRREPVGER